MMFAAAVGHRSGRATPSLRGAPQRQSMEIVRRETIYRNRNAVQTNPATSPVPLACNRHRLLHSLAGRLARRRPTEGGRLLLGNLGSACFASGHARIARRPIAWS